MHRCPAPVVPGATRGWRRLFCWGGATLLALALAGCNNSPQPEGDAAENTLFAAFAERSPRYLDPTASYSNNEAHYTFSFYEPLYAYHYLKRPYELVPRLAESVAQPHYLDKNGQPLPQDAPGEQVAESVYEVKIKPGSRYAPHPAFATDAKGRYLYHSVTPEQLGDKRSPWDFEHLGTREVVAEDLVYGLKRHATTRIKAPVFGVFSEYVIGLKEYGALIREEDRKLRAGQDAASRDRPFLDFRKYPLAGVQAIDKYTVRYRLKGKYPQWKYWMAMPFLAPVPWEADAFYDQPGMAERGLSLNVWPVGSGPYMLAEYVQDRRHVLKRNPNYRHDPYPCEGMPGDKEAGLLEDCGKPMPFVDKVVVTMEKENLPIKSKFRQGYYDLPEIEKPEYGVEFALAMQDSPAVHEEYTAKGFKVPRNVDLTNWYVGFNWLDPVVGAGDTPERAQRNRKLRQALSIAIDWEEYTRVFPRKGGEVAMAPVPAGMFGSRHGTTAGINPVTHRVVNGQPVRRSLDEARQLLAEAGYPNGRDAKTGQPLVLHYDYQRVPTPDLKPEIDWMVKQFAKLDVQLEVRATTYNQFQDKVNKGGHQVIWWGWVADYPDSENFLFLLYGPNAKSKYDGENAINYLNPEYDKRYARLRLMDDGPEKQKLIDEMVSILQQDAPWAFGFFPYTSGAYQSWVDNAKPAMMIRDQLRYFRVDPAARVARQREWNQPVWWPMGLLGLGVLALIWLTRSRVRERDRLTARGEILKEA